VRQLVIATGNALKFREYCVLLAGTGFELISCQTDVVEDADSYVGNAQRKALRATHMTGLPAVGEDAGIEVAALGGLPGLRSARFGGAPVERTRALIKHLEPLPRPWEAQFVCSLVLAVPGHEPVSFHGCRAGEVVPDWRGEVGFGYDPIFLVPEAGKTFGQMTLKEKNQWSHRAAAVHELLQSKARACL
jgi:XTP/dITP diphosphohydrolase